MMVGFCLGTWLRVKMKYPGLFFVAECGSTHRLQRESLGHERQATTSKGPVMKWGGGWELAEAGVFANKGR